MQPSLNRLAASATLHCLIGCGIGEILGMIISSHLGWSAAPSVALAIGLAFLFGYGFSMWPLLRSNMPLRKVVGLALAADTASITTMEIVDNAFILAVPGAIHAELDSPLFWLSLSAALAVAFLVAYPLNRWLISRGKGHAVMHEHHHSH
jgi:putative flippase GtrA